MKVPKALIEAPALTRRLYALNGTAGLSDTGLQILLLLGHVGGGLRAKAIQDALALEQSRASHLLTGLASAGLVSWTTSAAHSRHRSYRLTRRGRSIVEQFVRRAILVLDETPASSPRAD